MIKSIKYNVILIISLLLFTICNSKTLKFDHYGVYLKSKSGIIEIKGYDWSGMNDIYKNSRNFDKTIIEIKDDIIIYVYSAKAKLLEYKLLANPNRTKDGDFKCANFGFGRGCPEVAITSKPSDKNDDVITITAQVSAQMDDNIFILHEKERNKGYIFAARTESFVTLLKKEEEIKKDKLKDPNYNRQNVISDCNNFYAMAIAYWRTPKTRGGGGNTTFGNNKAAVISGVGKYLEFNADGVFTNENGTYILGYTSPNIITITGVGNLIGRDNTEKVEVKITITGSSASPDCSITIGN